MAKRYVLLTRNFSIKDKLGLQAPFGFYSSCDSDNLKYIPNASSAKHFHLKKDAIDFAECKDMLDFVTPEEVMVSADGSVHFADSSIEEVYQIYIKEFSATKEAFITDLMTKYNCDLSEFLSTIPMDVFETIVRDFRILGVKS